MTRRHFLVIFVEVPPASLPLLCHFALPEAEEDVFSSEKAIEEGRACVHPTEYIFKYVYRTVWQ